MQKFIKTRIIALTLALLAFSGISLFAQNSFVLFDRATGKILLEQDARRAQPVGSAAIVALATVVFDWNGSTGMSLNKKVQVPGSAVASVIGLRPGDSVSISNLLYAAILSGDALAADAVAYAIGSDMLARMQRSGNPIGFFVEQMNIMAGLCGASSTKFYSPSGSESRSVSSPADMALVATRATAHASLRPFFRAKSRTISITRGGSSLSLTAKNNNSVLNQNGIIGLHAGYSANSGFSHILFNRDFGLVVLKAASKVDGADAAMLSQAKNLRDQWTAAGRVVNSSKELLWRERKPPFF